MCGDCISETSAFIFATSERLQLEGKSVGHTADKIHHYTKMCSGCLLFIHPLRSKAVLLTPPSGIKACICAKMVTEPSWAHHSLPLSINNKAWKKTSLGVKPIIRAEVIPLRRINMARARGESWEATGWAMKRSDHRPMRSKDESRDAEKICCSPPPLDKRRRGLWLTGENC